VEAAILGLYKNFFSLRRIYKILTTQTRSDFDRNNFFYNKNAMGIFFVEDLWYINPAKFDTTYSKSFIEDLWYINSVKFDTTYSKSFIKNVIILKCHSCDCVSSFWEEVNLCRSFQLFVYFFCACLTPGPWFPMSYVVVFFLMFNDLRWGVAVCFVDIGGIIDHHCLNSLFTMDIKW
jgi:hypothetical protein